MQVGMGQAARANALAGLQGLADKASYQVADALEQPFPDNSFDLVWSMESGEHMPNKPKFVHELVRVCAPGGRILIVTWCHRWPTPPLPLSFRNPSKSFRSSRFQKARPRLCCNEPSSVMEGNQGAEYRGGLSRSPSWCAPGFGQARVEFRPGRLRFGRHVSFGRLHLDEDSTGFDRPPGGGASKDQEVCRAIKFGVWLLTGLAWISGVLCPEKDLLESEGASAAEKAPSFFWVQKDAVAWVGNDRCRVAGRNLEAGETQLRPEEQALLKKICDAYYLPEWCSINDYKALFEKEGLLVTTPSLSLPSSAAEAESTTQRLGTEPLVVAFGRGFW